MNISDVPYAETLRDHMQRSISFALEEDIGPGDITAQLIPAENQAEASIICKQDHAIVCGREWVDEVFRQVDSTVQLDWQVEDGEPLCNGQVLVTIKGNARSILTAERTALNYLQMLSGTATTSREYSDAVAGLGITVLDTRKTIPGLRLAQKYAVKVGGCDNHRLALYDMFLIKENHIAAAGGIEQAVARAKQIAPDADMEIEVETLEELQQALEVKPRYIMLDDFDEQTTQQALEIAKNADTQLEISGGLDLGNLPQDKRFEGVRASSGQLTKMITPVDFSLRVK